MNYRNKPNRPNIQYRNSYLFPIFCQRIKIKEFLDLKISRIIRFPIRVRGTPSHTARRLTKENSPPLSLLITSTTAGDRGLSKSVTNCDYAPSLFKIALRRRQLSMGKPRPDVEEAACTAASHGRTGHTWLRTGRMRKAKKKF